MVRGVISLSVEMSASPRNPDPVLRLVRDVIAPVLRPAGFKGSGTTFFITREANIGVVNVQKSRDPGAPKFTLNGGVFSTKLGGQSSRRPSLWDCHYQVRIGQLLRPPRDVWWEIPDRDKTHAEDFAQEVASHLSQVLVPAVERHLTDRDLRDFWMSRWIGGLASFSEIGFLSRLVDSMGPTEAAEPLRSIVDAGPGSARRAPAELATTLKLRGYRVVASGGRD